MLSPCLIVVSENFVVRFVKKKVEKFLRLPVADNSPGSYAIKQFAELLCN
jgi:hypothetical protein